jgi:hypothetical protein
VTEQPQPPAAFTGLTHAEALAIDLSTLPSTQLVQNLVERGTPGTIAGVPETYKSWLAYAIAVGIASGTGTILGQPVIAQGPVGYWWQDDSERNELERIQLYARVRGTPADLPLHWYLNLGLSLPDDLARLRATIEERGLVLAVLDSFYNIAGGVDLKDRGAGEVVAALKSHVCDTTGCSVLIVDHAPWPTDGNGGQARAYGDVHKGAAVRWGIYLQRKGKAYYVEARGNNHAGIKRTPFTFSNETLELQLVPTTPATDPVEHPDVLDWLTDYVAARHAQDGAGVPRGEAEQAYHDAHEGSGRNLARRVIDWQLALAAEAEEAGDTGETSGDTLIRLARGSGGTSHGVYLYPGNDAPSPLAATPSGGTGGSRTGATSSGGVAGVATSPEGGGAQPAAPPVAGEAASSEDDDFPF